MKPKKQLINKVLCVLLITFGVCGALAAAWYIRIYGDAGISAVIFTLAVGVEGAESGLIVNYLLTSLLPAALISAAFSFILLYGGRFQIIFKGRSGKMPRVIYPFSKLARTILSIILCLVLLTAGLSSTGFFKYAVAVSRETTLYENYYVSPKKVSIKFPESKRNLICIYLESMETTYLSEELGGALPYNAIQELYELARDNVNFSQNDGIGGWQRFNNTTCTTAALIAQTSGIPMAVATDENFQSQFQDVLPGVCGINNILNDEGYTQAVMFGSPAEYAGREQYFTSHGVGNVYDYNTALEEEFIPKGYKAWWGFEDNKLFDYAKLKLTEMAQKDDPFAFTLLTADTHHVDGFICEDCGSDYSEQYSNVIACSSRKVSEFVGWIQSQEFFENTTVIICGDHLSMGAEYFRRNIEKNYVRRSYNCIINSAANGNEKNREFTPMDMFPTTLAAIGCEIEGNRLGLGTNLFSGEPTIAEKMGVQTLNREIEKHSDYYINTFISPK